MSVYEVAFVERIRNLLSLCYLVSRERKSSDGATTRDYRDYLTVGFEELSELPIG